MIKHRFVKSIEELNDLILELEITCEFRMITILPISSGYILYYDLKERFGNEI